MPGSSLVGAYRVRNEVLIRLIDRFYQKPRRPRVPLRPRRLPRMGFRLAVINSNLPADTVVAEASMPAWNWGVPGGPCQPKTAENTKA